MREDRESLCPPICLISRRAPQGTPGAYWAMNPKAAPGAGGVPWVAYGQDLEANLRDLMHRIVNRWLPLTRIGHPFPEARFAATHPR